MCVCVCMCVCVYIFVNSSKQFEMSLIPSFSFQVTKNIDNIFCRLHLVVSINILPQNVSSQSTGCNFPPSRTHEKGFSNTGASNKLRISKAVKHTSGIETTRTGQRFSQIPGAKDTQEEPGKMPMRHLNWWPSGSKPHCNTLQLFYIIGWNSFRGKKSSYKGSKINQREEKITIELL